MPAINVSVYVKDEDYSVYLENKGRLLAAARDEFKQQMVLLKEVKQE